jgi:hypothetical protein
MKGDEMPDNLRVLLVRAEKPKSSPTGAVVKASPPLGRMVIKLVKRGEKAVTRNPIWNPVEQESMGNMSEDAIEPSLL